MSISVGGGESHPGRSFSCMPRKRSRGALLLLEDSPGQPHDLRKIAGDKIPQAFHLNGSGRGGLRRKPFAGHTATHGPAIIFPGRYPRTRCIGTFELGLVYNLVPVNRIPPNIFSTILDYWADEDAVEEYLITEIHVCRGWRNPLNSLPSL